MVERRQRSSGRRPPPRRRQQAGGGVPPWVMVIMIAGPLVAILAALVIRGGRVDQGEEQQEEVVEEDPNAGLKKLEGQVSIIQKEVRSIMRASQRDSTPKLQARVEKVKRRIEVWMRKCDKLLEPHRDEEGNLHEDYGYYGQVRSRVNTLRVDLLKVSSF